jgi:hypothetical protein
VLNYSLISRISIFSLRMFEPIQVFLVLLSTAELSSYLNFFKLNIDCHPMIM